MWSSRRTTLVASLLFEFSLFASSNAFYLPGAAPHDYHKGEDVRLLVNTLTPMLAGNDHAKLVCLVYLDSSTLFSDVGLPRLEIPHQLYVHT